MKYAVENTYTEYEVEVMLKKDFANLKETWSESQYDEYDNMVEECFVYHTTTADEIGKAFDIPVDLVIYDGWFYVED